MSLSSFLYVTPPCNNRSLHTKSCHPQHRDLKNQAESQHCDDRLTNTEQVVARWQSLVAYTKALDLLHQAMRSAFHRRTDMAIEMARDGGAFIRRRRLF